MLEVDDLVELIMSRTRTNISSLLKGQPAKQYWCVLGTAEGLRQDSAPKHALPTSVISFANLEVGT